MSIRDEGFACRICVEGIHFAHQILASLSRSFVFKTSEPMDQHSHPSLCIFRVAYGSQHSYRKLTGLISKIPGVRLQIERISEDVNLEDTQHAIASKVRAARST